MVKNKIIKNENKEVEPIGGLLINDYKNNVLGGYLNVNKLNFSLNSLKIVDNYLEKIRNNRKKLSDQEIKKIILRCGTYLGEVIRKADPKRFLWISFDTASKIYDGNELPLKQDITTHFILYDKINERFWFPLSKAYKFINYGKADNLWSFATVCLKFKNKK